MMLAAEREQVVTVCGALLEQNLVVGTAGNVSVRVGDVIAISLQGAGHLFGAVWSVDGRGQVTLHLPEEGGAAVALQAAEGDPGPLDVSFLTGLVQKSFAFFLAQQKSKQEDEPSLIVKP